MPRLLWLLLIPVLLWPLFAAGPAIAGTGGIIKRGIDKRDMVPIKWEKMIGAEDVPVTYEKPTYEGNNALGYFMAGTVQVGLTHQDYQSNGSQRRQIAVGNGFAIGQGRVNVVHNVWTKLPAASTADRTVQYTSYVIGGVVDPPVDASAVGGGYCSLDADTAGYANPAWHVAVLGSQTARDFSFGVGSFSEYTMPAALCAPETGTGGAADGFYIWPFVCADQDAAGLPFVHLVGTEATPAPGDVQSLVYYRSNAGNTAPAGTCGKLMDSTYTISAVVCQDPASNKVAIVFCKPRFYGASSSQVKNDVAYYESTNLGATGSWVFTNVTNYTDAALSNAYTEVAALYKDGALHIIWNTQENDGVGGYYSQASKLFHWDATNNCISMLINADNVQNCLPGAWSRNINKISLSECTVGGIKKLYAVYTYFRGDVDGVASGDPGPEDCSNAGYANGEVYAQVSETGGLTWGPPTNLTSTPSPLCAVGACKSEHWTSSAMYVSDSLRIQYIWDKDAGAVLKTEGSWTNNAVMNLATPCFAMSTFRSLSATPSGLTYPKVHTVPGYSTNETLVLSNSGNASAPYNRTVSYVSGPSSGWLAFSTPASSSVPAGCSNTETIVVTVNGPASPQGLSKADIVFTYESGTKTLTVPVELWNFNPFYLPEYATIRTNSNMANVQQVSRAGGGGNATSPTFTYFADTSSYLHDASLIIGNAIDNLSWQIFEGGSSVGPSPTNPYGYLYALSNITYDSTTFPSYRIASGRGCNRDSTLQFDVQWYAPKHADSAEFYIAHFDVQLGPKSSTTVSNVTIAYAADWDIPNDTSGSSKNQSGFDETLQMVYQQGLWTAPNINRYGGIAAIKDDNTPIEGGFVWENSRSVYPVNGYENDTLWNKLQAAVGFSTTDSLIDLNSVLVIDKGVSIASTTHYKFSVIFAGQYKTGGSLAGLKNAIAKAKKFICAHIVPTAPWCGPACNTCGDANSDGIISIGDAVALIKYVFTGACIPGDCNYPRGKGDFNGDGGISISDAVNCIQFIFQGTPCPHCQGMSCWTTTFSAEAAEGPKSTAEISIGCPVTILTSQLTPGDSFQVRVYLKNDFEVSGFSIGLKYSSNYVEVTSVDTTGSIIPPQGLTDLEASFYPSTNQCLVGWPEWINGIPSRTQRGLLFTLNMRMLPGISAETIDLQTVFVPPAGYLEVSDFCGARSVPTYSDCGTEDIILGSPVQITYDPSFNVCPMGDAPFNVLLSDGKGPIVGDTTLSIAFQNCGQVLSCTSGGFPTTLMPIGPSDANGKVTFFAKGFKCSLVCQATLLRNGSPVAVIPVRSFDIDADSTVSLPNDYDGSFCNDYNGNGYIDFNDQNLLSQHLGHACTPNPCALFGYDFQLIPNTNLSPGQVVTLQLTLWNNNPTQSCFVGTVAFYYATFGTGGADTLIGDPYLYIHTLQPGEQDTISVPYTIPGYGARCLKARFTTNCCGTQLELSQCLDIVQQCRTDESHIYYFTIRLKEPAYGMLRFPYLLPGWTMSDVHIPAFPTFASDSIVYTIRTASSNDLGDSSSVTTYILDSPNDPTPQAFVNQVVITSNTGDASGDCIINITDAVYLIAYIFSGGPEPRPYRAGDVDCNTIVNITDVVYLINYIFASGPPPCLVGD